LNTPNRHKPDPDAKGAKEDDQTDSPSVYAHTLPQSLLVGRHACILNIISIVYTLLYAHVCLLF